MKNNIVIYKIKKEVNYKIPKKTTPYITQFFNRDRLAFTALSRTGYVTIINLKSCGLADTRIKNYIRDGLVEKIAYKQGKVTKVIAEAYKLTKEGRELAENQWSLRNHYHAQTPLHDLALSNKYFSLTEQQKNLWKTETELRELFLERMEQIKGQGQEETAKGYEDMLSKGIISMPDASYVNDQGIEVAFEIITNNYGKEELQAKEAFVKIMGTKYETTRV